MTQERRLLILALLVAGTLWVLSLLSSVLMPFVAGALVAYLCDPAVDRLQKWRCSRTVATSIVTVGFIIVVVALILLLVPLVQAQVTNLVERVPSYVAAVKGEMQQAIGRTQSEATQDILNRLRGFASEHVGDLAGWVGGLVKRIVTGSFLIFNILSLLVITPLVAFYLLLDWDHIIGHVESLLPRDIAPTVRKVFSDIDRTLAGFVRGQTTVCLIQAAYYAIGLTLAGLDFGLVVGLVSGLISFIPYVGSTLGLLTSVGLALVQFNDWGRVAIVAGVFLVGQFIEGNFLTPRIVGGRIGLHPVWVIFALLAGGTLFGFTGVLLAVPVAAAIGVLVRFWASRYRQSALYRGGSQAIVIAREDRER